MRRATPFIVLAARGREFWLERGEMGAGRLQFGGERGIINRFENGRKVSVWNRIGFCWIWR